MDINEVTRYIQKHNLFLHFDDRLGVDLWSPHTPVAPLAVRQSIYSHREQLRTMMLAACIDVCPSPKLHRRSWRDKVCLLCLQIDRNILEREEKPMLMKQLRRKQRVINGQVMTVQAQFRRCNKQRCRCQQPGKGKHGPYWYGYWHENGKLRSRYIGKELPSAEQLPSAG